LKSYTQVGLVYTLKSWFDYTFLFNGSNKANFIYTTDNIALISYVILTKTVFWVALASVLSRWWFGKKWIEVIGLKVWNKKTIFWAVLATILSFWWVVIGLIVEPNTPKFNLGIINLRYIYFNFIGYSFTEEILFRGFIQSFLILHFNSKVSILIQSILFVLYHLCWWFFAGVYDFEGVIQVFALGLIYGFIRYKSKSLWPSIFAHGIYDFTLGLIQ